MEEIDSDKVDISENVLVSSNEMILMQTAMTEIRKPNNKVSEDIPVLLDSGSQRTYITESLARRLGLTIGEKQEIKLVTFGADKPKKILLQHKYN